MANYSTLKAAVADVVKTNGSQAITGANLQTVLLSIINSIGGGGYIFNGVATPSTDAGTPDQNVFYIGGAGTYANFGTSVVVPPTNIAVFKYNGSWACEQVTVENGGVFDISAYNNNTTYADLAAALGTNGANVPESVRKGGMSVKFVCSSDNKYIQARCMAQNFTTDVTQWQGVDDEPTNNSSNLVDSNGIAQAISKYQLYQGLCSANGIANGAANTVTTKAIKKFADKIYIGCNKNLNIRIRTGSSPTSLPTDMSTVAYNGKSYVLETTDAYFAVSIQAQIQVGTITPTSDIGLVIADDNSVFAANDRKHREEKKNSNIANVNSGSGSVFFPFYQGRWGNNESMANITTVISSQIVAVDGKYSCSVFPSYKMTVRYRAEGESTFTEIATRVTQFTFEGKGDVFVIIENSNYTTNILPTAATGFVFYSTTYLGIVDDDEYEWTVEGTSNEGTAYYAAHYLLKKGVKYDFSFDSSNYQIKEGSTSGVILFSYPANDGGDRINLITIGQTLPSVTSITPTRDSILYAACNLSFGAFLNVKIKQNLEISSIVKLRSNDIDNMAKFNRYLVQDMFTKGNTVSNMKYKMVITDGFDINKNTGEVCIGYCGMVGYAETSGNRYSGHLAICSLGDIEGTKRDIPALIVGETYNGIYIGQFSHVIAVWTGDDEITIVGRNGHSTNNNALLARKYTPSTETWGDVVVCDVQVGSNTPIQMLSAQANCEQFWQESGVEHPLARGNVHQYSFFPAGNPVRIGDYFYLSMVCGDFAHPLLRSQDMVHYEFVTDIPYSDGEHGVFSPTEEVSICYYQDRIYALTRGNYGEYPDHPDEGWNTILYCDFEKVANKTAQRTDWTVEVIEYCAHERTTIVGINGRLITLNGLKPNGSHFVDGENVSSRGRKNLRIYDTALNLLGSVVLDPDTQFLHPIFVNHAGSIISVLSSDLRGFSYYNEGDTRHEIMVTRLNPELLYMIAE